MEKQNWFVIIVVVIIVAVIASLITANITGNVIKVKTDSRGKEVYTKAEIEGLHSKIFDLINDLTDRLSKLEGGSGQSEYRCSTILKVARITNQSSPLPSDDEVLLTVIKSKDNPRGYIYNVNMQKEGEGFISILGVGYKVLYHGSNMVSEDQRWIEVIPLSGTLGTENIMESSGVMKNGYLLSGDCIIETIPV